jgi:hypothetical protein
MAKGIFLDPGQGTIYSARGSKMAFKALHATTGGAFSLMERELSMSWTVPSSSSSEEKAKKEDLDFGRWHQAA